MIDPALALGLFALLAVVTAVVVWPRWGVVASLRRGSKATLRVGMEDALKHLYKCQRHGREATVESVAGSLEVPQAAASRILMELRSAGLVETGRPTVLTDEGQRYALRIIRTHRLWERFLADRTGVEPGEWHERAEDQEHRLSPRDVDELDASLGRPRFDPHGDPIPTATGEMPEAIGVPLTHLEAGEEGMIVHLEDEPRPLYDRLVAGGLSPHMRFRVLPSDDEDIHLAVDGRTLTLDAAAAANVTVDASSAMPGPTEWSGVTLEDLSPGESGEVVHLSPACQGIQRRRLLDLGVVPGTRITAELAAASGDPTAFRIRGALVALRREQQRWVRIRRAEEVAA
ncbi:MAG: metal-dependent transcriptional regulator [Gemmatimonadota bacterium]